MLTLPDGYYEEKLSLETNSFWILDDFSRTLLAKWAANLGGDKQQIQSMLEEARQKGIKYITPKEFFTREDVPGLFEDD